MPALAIVGASFTAGVGPGNPGKSWAVLLARLLHWDAVVYGDPGAGYVRAGVGRMGPVAAEIARIDLRALAPALVIVQAGHDDIGVPLRLEQRRVAAGHGVDPGPGAARPDRAAHRLRRALTLGPPPTGPTRPS